MQETTRSGQNPARADPKTSDETQAGSKAQAETQQSF